MPSLKAYTVSEDDEGNSVVVFAKHNATARRTGAGMLDGDWSGVECRRAPEFDAYAPGPVPKLALLEHGWWMECSCHDCARRIDLSREDDEDEAGEPLPPLAPVAMGDLVFCNAECCGRHCAYRRANEAAKTALVELICTRFPDALVSRVHVYGDRLEPTEHRNGFQVGGVKSLIEFHLPGLIYSVRYDFGDPRYWVSKLDEAAFRARYSSERLPA